MKQKQVNFKDNCASGFYLLYKGSVMIDRSIDITNKLFPFYCILIHVLNCRYLAHESSPQNGLKATENVNYTFITLRQV
jgi:hypothetical protein